MSFDPEKIYNLVLSSGETWVDCEAAANILEETKSIVLASLSVVLRSFPLAPITV